jgi:hypothetical protein
MGVSKLTNYATLTNALQVDLPVSTRVNRPLAVVSQFRAEFGDQGSGARFMRGGSPYSCDPALGQSTNTFSTPSPIVVSEMTDYGGE